MLAGLRPRLRLTCQSTRRAMSHQPQEELSTVDKVKEELIPNKPEAYEAGTGTATVTFRGQEVEVVKGELLRTALLRRELTPHNGFTKVRQFYENSKYSGQ
jgi:hypothetical protein